MTNASSEQIAAANEAQAAKAANVQRVAQGLPQIADRKPRKAKSMMDILRANMSTTAPAPTSGKQVTAAASAADVAKVCPELVNGLIRPDGTPHPGAQVYKDEAGAFGPPGAVYVGRQFVKVTKRIAKFILDKFGGANRTSTASRLKKYTAAMDVGIGGTTGPDGWNFVFNSCLFTVDSIGNVTGIDQEQHNAAHSFKSLLACADPNATILMQFGWGVPKKLRDLMDDNQARSAKDIASTRTELKDMFAVGSMIGGLVKIDKEAMQTRCIGFVSQAVAIVNNIRNGESAKTGGNQGVDAEVLDKYSHLVGSCVQGLVALDAVSQHDTIAPKTGLLKKVTSGGLTKLYAINHLASTQALIAGYVKPDGSLGYAEDIGNEVLAAYGLMANRSENDASEPMVSLRHQIETWKRNKQHEGSSGKNVVYIALCKALLLHLSGGKVVNVNWLSKLDSKTKRENLSGCGTVQVDELGNVVDDGGTEIVVGIDDYVNPGDAAMDEAGVAATEADATLEELIDDDELTEVAGDMPEELEESVDE